jgi:hypothetical protein
VAGFRELDDKPQNSIKIPNFLANAAALNVYRINEDMVCRQ